MRKWVIRMGARAAQGFSVSPIDLILMVALRERSIEGMAAIRVIFDGKTFVPQQRVSLPPQSEALVLVENNDPVAQQQFDAAVRA